ncbi:hypothetical protein [Sphingomonas sp.]|uniref:hypothetical protein n=1 Tax=Sphingomonas sp. TaxID=28214 RepID=UPI003CC687FC
MQDTPTPRTPQTKLTPRHREEIVRRYWLKGELTPLGVANWLAGQPTPQHA